MDYIELKLTQLKNPKFIIPFHEYRFEESESRHPRFWKYGGIKEIFAELKYIIRIQKLGNIFPWMILSKRNDRMT